MNAFLFYNFSKRERLCLALGTLGPIIRFRGPEEETNNLIGTCGYALFLTPPKLYCRIIVKTLVFLYKFLILLNSNDVRYKFLRKLSSGIVRTLITMFTLRQLHKI